LEVKKAHNVMKKAKIMLLAITVLAVVGGALAFKVKTTTAPFICVTTVGGDQICVAEKATIANANTVDPFTSLYTTDIVPTNVKVDADAYCATRDCGDLETSFTFDE
jgi:hypothetical protein